MSFQKLNLLQRKFFNKSLFIKITYSLIFIFLATFFWYSLILGNLRFLIPNFWRVTGLPFTSRNYLIIFQNEAEMRPTGGFISAYANLKFHHGFPSSLQIEDVYGEIMHHESIQPPKVMGELLAGPTYPGYGFRDMNFSPNFPNSARTLANFYLKIFPKDKKIDGVIAINFHVLEDLLDLVGPIKIDDEIFTADNLFAKLEASVSDIDKHDENALANRKNILKDVAQKIVKKIIFSPWKHPKFLLIMQKNLAERHIQLYFSNKALQEKISDKGWSGEIPLVKQDFLGLAEANLGGMKTDRYLSRDIQYDVTITDERDKNGKRVAFGDLTITLHNQADDNLPISGFYKGYFRALTASGSTLITGNIYNEYEEFDKKIFGEIAKININEDQTIKLKYHLRDGIVDGEQYSLYLRKQPGTIADHYRITIKTPQGTGIKSNDFTTRENLAIASFNLEKDRILNLSILPDRDPPAIVDQYFSDPNTITIRFNEDLSFNKIIERDYVVDDSDIINPKHDDLKILKVDHTNRTIFLKLAGISKQKEERYKITLRGLADIHGNFLPERTVTAVWR